MKHYTRYLLHVMVLFEFLLSCFTGHSIYSRPLSLPMPMLKFFVLKFLIFSMPQTKSSAGEIMGLRKAFICQELVTTEWKLVA